MTVHGDVLAAAPDGILWRFVQAVSIFGWLVIALATAAIVLAEVIPSNFGSRGNGSRQS